MLELGAKIRKLRQNKGYKIEKMAELTGLSAGLISQIERDLVGASVTSIWKIAKTLGVPVGYFFDESPKIGPIVKKNRRRKLLFPDSDVAYELLTPNSHRRLELLLLEIQPGQCNRFDEMEHEGEECGFIISGSMVVYWGEESYLLEEGDSISFDCFIPHRFSNEGEIPCRSIWAITPPAF